MTKPEDVTQEDRDLVVSFYSSSHATFWPDNFSKAMETCDEIKRGHCDNWELVQAFARHRTTSLAAQDGLVEAARKAVVSYAFHECQPDNGHIFSWIDDRAQEIAEAVLSAIKEQHHD